jgi:hypothetical protein
MLRLQVEWTDNALDCNRLRSQLQNRPVSSEQNAIVESCKSVRPEGYRPINPHAAIPAAVRLT